MFFIIGLKSDIFLFIYNFIQQGHVTFIKGNKDIYNVTKDFYFK